jgi:hypothetical protein
MFEYIKSFFIKEEILSEEEKLFKTIEDSLSEKTDYFENTLNDFVEDCIYLI